MDFNKFQIPYGIYDMSVKSKFDPVKIKTRFEFVNWALAASLDLEQGLLNILIEYIPLHYITYRSITIYRRCMISSACYHMQTDALV